MPTLDSVSTPDDASTRLSNALEEVFSRGVPKSPAPDDGSVPAPLDGAPVADWSVDDDVTGPGEVTEAFVLPTIVPATEDEPSVDEPAERPVLAPPPPAAPVAPVPPPVTVNPYQSASPATAAQPPRPATAWGDHMTVSPAAMQGANLRAPGRRPRVRRVTRVLRHIDPWSTFKVALLFSLVGYVVALTSGVLLWRVADSTGTLDNVERWFTQFGWETFQLKGDEIFHNATIIGLFVAVAVTGGLVLLATLFNLVSDIVGGVRLTVLEEEVVERTISSTRRYVVRRPPSGGVAARQTGPDWDVDGDEPVATAVPASGPTDGAAPPVADWTVDDD